MKTRVNFFMAFCCLILVFSSQSCSNNEVIYEEPQVTTRTHMRSAFHWTCKYCKFLNAGWRHDCVQCHKPYDSNHGEMIMTFLDIIKTHITFVSEINGGAYPNDDVHPLQLPNAMFALEMPEGWYDTPSVRKIYDDYFFNNRLDLRPMEFQEGFALGWYRTVRSLYPQYHQKSQVKYTYDKISIKYNSLITGTFGSGLKEGTKLAVNTFCKN